MEPARESVVGVRKPVVVESTTAAGDAPPKAAVAHNLPFDAYMRRGDCSKSTLWTLYTKSPAHSRVETETSLAMQLGTAIHCAVLEPEAFDGRFTRGPEDRRGNRWKEAVDEHGEGLLTAGDYDAALRVRDALQRDALVRRLTAGDVWREASGFWRDPETGLVVRCRPDAYHPGLRLLVDLKTTTDARANVWRKRVADFGYHAQEALYTDGWTACGMGVDAFVFIVVETGPPYAHAIFDLAPAAVAEGRAAMRQALATFAQCKAEEIWPAYPSDVQSLDVPPYAYRLTQPEITAND
jgi:exodeoxyribonuclease VIII